jgi:hypothetical protein
MSSIDEKKNEPGKLNFSGFFKNYAISIIFTIGISVFLFGTIGLYCSKIAQANILPTDSELAPYTMYDRILKKDLPIDIHIMKPEMFAEPKETMSQKAIFNSQIFLDSFANSFLCSLQDSGHADSSMFSNIPLYLSSVYGDLLAKIFSAITTIFYGLSFLPEFAVMILYGFLHYIIWFFIFLYALGCSTIYHITNILQLFRVPSETDESKWEAYKDIHILRFMKLVLVWFSIIPICFSVFASACIMTLYAFFAPLYATYVVKNDPSNKIRGLFDFIKETLKYKQFFFFVLASVSLLYNGVNNFGNASAIPILVGIFVAWFMGLYSNEMPSSSDFSVGIRAKSIQSEVLKLDKNKLLSMCNIPTMDDIAAPGASIRKIKSNGGSVGDKHVRFSVPDNGEDNIELKNIANNTETNNTETNNTETNNTETNNTETNNTETNNTETNNTANTEESIAPMKAPETLPINPIETQKGGRKLRRSKEFQLKFV